MKKRRWQEDERLLTVDLLPAWRHKKAKTLDRREVSELLDGIVERGSPIMANRTKALISKIYNFAKNGLAYRVAIAPLTRSLLEELHERTGSSAWVFASLRRQGAHITAVQRAAERVAKTTNIDFVPHDLRRTAASFMTSMGISRLVVSKILNHVESGITAVYDRHSYDAEKWDALHMWSQKPEIILDEVVTDQVGCS